MPGNSHTSVRSRQVANQIRRLREQAQLSCSEVARTLGLSVSKVSRMETGVTGLRAEDVAAMLGLYRVSATKRQQVLDLLHRSDEKGWWQRQAGLPQLWRNLIDFEAKATRIQNFENMIVPGLLQTAEYCRAILHALDHTLSEEEVNQLVPARMARQALLTRHDAPQYLAVLDENVLRRPVGEEGLMSRQLLHLSGLAERPNVTVRVIPAVVGPYAGWYGPFLIMEFFEEPSLVHLENHGTGMFLEEHSDLSSYRRVLSDILSKALAPADSLDLIREIGAEADEAGVNANRAKFALVQE